MKNTFDTTSLTIHGASRIMERRNLKNERSLEKHMALALQRGKPAENYTSWERSFLTKATRNNCIAIAYNNYCYIINQNGACVTMYPLPSWFGKKKHFNGKERIRDYKRYCRSNSVFFEPSINC